MSAEQNRLFPIGKASQGFIFLEVHLSRLGKSETNPEWKGKTYLVVYNSRHKKLLENFIADVTFFQTSYKSQLDKLFRKAMKFAKKLSEFTPAVPTQMIFCDYGRECSMATIYSKKSNLFVRLKNNEKEYSVFDFLDESELQAGFKEYNTLFISSVRRLRVGNNFMTILHLGTGHSLNVDIETGEPYPPEEYKPDFSFDSLKKSTFIEPVLHHGKGFDYFIIE
ncbi:MAG: hypothetical protein HQK76_20685 [Desulfobacterales bacterium]|nr:hypothetical protein [Desulfobacterales bacterium]